MRGAATADGQRMQLSLAAASRGPARSLRVRALTALAGAVATLALIAAPAVAAGPATLTPFAGDGVSSSVVPGPALDTLIRTSGMGADADANVYVTDGAGSQIDRITPD